MSLWEDVSSIRERAPAARGNLEIILLYPCVHAMVYHRVAHFLHTHRLRFLARAVSQWSRFCTGIEIHPGAKIGKGLLIDHGSGVVIGETTEIGDYCTLYQGVTLGGTGKEQGKRHPTLGNNVLVGTGARVLGSITIGDGARIAANAVVLENVPPNGTAVGVPARIVRIGGQKVNPLDHTRIPDPVSQEFCRMSARIDQLERELERLRASLNEKEGQEA